MSLKWLEWATQLQALAQNGLTFSQDPYDIERYHSIRQIATEIVAAHSTLDTALVKALFESETGYATPKVDVRAAVFQDDKILLVKETDDAGWSLPGGWADVNDAPSNSVVREVWEEAGYKARTVKLVALYDRNQPRHGHPPYLYHVYKAFFQCELLEVSPSGGAEMKEIAFFAEAELTSLTLSSTRVTLSQLKRLFDHYKNPDLPTDFD